MSEGISYKRRWQAITLGTLVLVPAYWGILVGAVSAASDDRSGIANPAAAVATSFVLSETFTTVSSVCDRRHGVFLSRRTMASTGRRCN